MIHYGARGVSFLVHSGLLMSERKTLEISDENALVILNDYIHALETKGRVCKAIPQRVYSWYGLAGYANSRLGIKQSLLKGMLW